MVSYDSQSDLVLSCQDGDRDSLGKLAQIVSQRLWRYLCKLTSDDDIAGDILQEVLLTMIQKINQLRNPDKFWPWVKTVASSKVKEYFRKNHIRIRAEKELKLIYLQNIQQRCNFQTQLSQREILRKIYYAKESLGNIYSEVFRLRCFAGMSYQEISVIMESSDQNTCVRFHRAKMLMREKFNKSIREYF